MDDRELSVRLNGKHIGLLSQDRSASMSFQYSPEAKAPLSLSMPVREQPYSSDVCEAYFGGLLPEGEPARFAIGKQFGINEKNTFSLLKAIGHDCAGAVSLHEVDEPELESDFIPLKGRILEEKELAKHIRELPTKPLFIGVDGLRLSLAGVQDKASVCLIDGQVALPQDGSPTTHILKPAINLLESTVQNEYLCLRLAKRFGFNVPDVELRSANGIPYLLIKRYDRVCQGNSLRRVHQEDFCQALGITTTYKYQKEGGAGFAECFELLKKTAQPAKARSHLADMVVFNYLVGNTDAHGKNFSLLHTDSGSVVLAPFYDILSTQVYPRLTQGMAMEIGGEYQISNIRAEHWQKFSKAVSFTATRMKAIIKEQTERLETLAQEERDALRDTPFDSKMLDKMLLFFKKQSFQARKRLEIKL